jgi:hypothetical protein
MDQQVDRPEGSEGSADAEGRRKFLSKCGRFAVVTPPAMTMLLSVALKPTEAHASTVLGGGWGGRPPRPRNIIKILIDLPKS